jgi:hypothetical protein
MMKAKPKVLAQLSRLCLAPMLWVRMQWKDITTKLEFLLEELTEVLAETEEDQRPSRDPEKAADTWIRQYVRSRSLTLPSKEVGMVLLARAEYAASLLRLAPSQELEMSVGKAAEIVEILMIDLWQCSIAESRPVKRTRHESAFAA